MDIERTMEFILQQQAKAEAEMAAMRQHQAEMQAQQAAAEAKAERQMTNIRKLIHTGMKMIVKNEEHIKEVASAQKVTEVKLQVLIDTLRRGRNGSHRKN